MSDERRRSDRLPVDLAGEMFLSDGRRVAVRIKNLGRLGALLQIDDLEDAVREGERAVLDHPLVAAPAEHVPGGQDEVGSERALTPCAIVRVDLEFQGDGVRRELAVFFDGGAPPEGYTLS